MVATLVLEAAALLAKPLLWAFLTWLAWHVFNVERRFKYRKIPGPVGLPLLGNLPELVFYDSPKYVQKLFKEYGKVFKFWLGNNPFFIVADPDVGRKLALKYGHADDAYSQMHLFNSYTGEVRDVDLVHCFSANGDCWRRGRRAFEGFLLHPSRLQEHMEPLNETCNKFLTRVDFFAASGAPVDMFRQFGDLTLAVIGQVGFGMDFGTLDGTNSNSAELLKLPYSQLPPARQLAKATYEVFESLVVGKGSVYLLGQLALPDWQPLWTFLEKYLPDKGQKAMMNARGKVIELSRQLMQQWLARSPEERARDRSFMSLLMAERKAASGVVKLTEHEVLGNAFVLVLGGYETTATTLAFTTYLLATNPSAEAELLREVDEFRNNYGDDNIMPADLTDKLPYLDAVIKESLRIYPPVTWQLRGLPADAPPVECDGYTFSGPCMMASPNYLYQHDPNFWPEPESFKPERFLPTPDGSANPLAPSPEVQARTMIPFGSGPRMCPGYKFALLEAKLTLFKLYSKYTFRMDPKVKLPLKTRTGLTQAPAEDLWMTVHAR